MEKGKPVPSMLVYECPFKTNGKQWGHKWIGFCYGKRFIIIQDIYAEMRIDKENGIYVLNEKGQEKFLPKEISNFIYGIPLSNQYFLTGKAREISIEIVMMLIEKGYDMESITMQKYIEYINGNRNNGNYLCQYIDNATREIIVEILDDTSVIWRGEI